MAKENLKRIFSKSRDTRVIRSDDLDCDPSQMDYNGLCEKIIEAVDHLRKSHSRANCVKNFRKKSSTNSKNKSTPSKNNSKRVTKNKSKVRRIEKSLAESPVLQVLNREVNRTEKYSYDEQCDMISFLVETNRISSCCSIYSWKVMAMRRSKKPPESLLKQFKSVIAPNIAQFLYQLSIIELPGVLNEFRLAINQAGINENESSAVLSETSSASSIIKERLREKMKRKNTSPISQIIPTKTSSVSTENDRKNRTNKIIGTNNNSVKVGQVSSTSAENEGNNDDKSLLASMIREAEENQIIIEKNHSNNSTDNFNNFNNNNGSVENVEILKKSIGWQLWEEMYGPITIGARVGMKRIELNENNIAMNRKNLKSVTFSRELLNALNSERTPSQHNHPFAYCIEEELAILHYFICKPQRIQYCLGNDSYKKISRERWPILRGRTSNSMQTRFRKYIVGYLDHFGLPDEILKEFLYWEWFRQNGKENKN